MEVKQKVYSTNENKMPEPLHTFPRFTSKLTTVAENFPGRTAAIFFPILQLHQYVKKEALKLQQSL